MLDAILEFQPSQYGQEAHHVFHGRGGLYKGCEHLMVDWYPPVWVITSFLPIDESDLAYWHQRLEEKWGQQQQQQEPLKEEMHPLTWVFQDRSVSPTINQLRAGALPEPPHIVTEHSCRYIVDLLRSQNSGLFLDMAVGRSFVRQQVAPTKTTTVLNLFAYTCSFSVAALQGGAHRVVNIDMARGPLRTGQRNHALNGVEDGAKFLCHNIFKSWGKLRKLGPYDMIVCDPPSYQKNSFVAATDYGKIVRRLPHLLQPNGIALLCLNAPELDAQFLRDVVSREAGSWMEFVKRLDNPSSYPVACPERALKVLVFRRRRVEDDTCHPPA